MRRAYTLVFLLAFSACVTHFEEWIEADVPENFKSSEPAGGITHLKTLIELNVGELTIEAGDPSLLYELEAQYNKSAFVPEVDLRRDEDEVNLSFRLIGEGKARGRLGKNQVHFRFNPAVALGIESKTGVGKADIDLTGLNLTNLELQSGVGETRISLLSPNAGDCQEITIRNGVGEFSAAGLGYLGFERLQFHGGIGEAILDFSGSWEKSGEVEIHVGVGGVEILLPRDLGAELSVSKSFFSGVDLSDFEKRGDTYYSNNLSRVDKVVRFRVSAGIGGVQVRWI